MTETSALPVRPPTVYRLLALVSVTDSDGVESRYERELTFIRVVDRQTGRVQRLRAFLDDSTHRRR